MITSRVNDVRFHRERDEQRAEAMKMLAQPEQEPVFWWNGGTQFATQKSKDWDKRTGGTTAFGCDIPLYTTPPQRTWAKLIRGVRVEGDTVVISVVGGNDGARELCGALINELEQAKQ